MGLALRVGVLILLLLLPPPPPPAGCLLVNTHTHAHAYTHARTFPPSLISARGGSDRLRVHSAGSRRRKSDSGICRRQSARATLRAAHTRDFLCSPPICASSRNQRIHSNSSSGGSSKEQSERHWGEAHEHCTPTPVLSQLLFLSHVQKLPCFVPLTSVATLLVAVVLLST